MSKPRFILLWPWWVMLVLQGCYDDTTPSVPVYKKHVTITLKGQPIIISFETRGEDYNKPFREVLEKLEKGERVDLSKPLDSSRVYYSANTPLEEAILRANSFPYVSTDRQASGFAIAHYLLEHGADPNTAIHRLCENLKYLKEDISALVLLLSYGAQLDLPNEEGKIGIDLLKGKTGIDLLNRFKPWSSNRRFGKDSDTSSVSSDELAAEAAAKAAEASLRPAWKEKITKEKLKSTLAYMIKNEKLKTEYFTNIVQQLLTINWSKNQRLHPSFVKYLEEETHVAKDLVEQLRKKT